MRKHGNSQKDFYLVILKYLISGSLFKKMATLLDILNVTLTDIRPVN